MPVARRLFGDSHELTLNMRCNYAITLYRDDDATLGDLREAVATLEDTTLTARRVLGGTHPDTVHIVLNLRDACARARAALRARDTPPSPNNDS